jgi:NAD(P) transhydrogenase subunit beta
LIGLAAGVAFILALKGLSHPKTARRGNLIGAAGATVATLSVFLYVNPIHHLLPVLGALAIGLIVGVPAARKVEMTQMPQLVALFNGVGGGAAALVAIVEYLHLRSRSHNR